MYNDKLTGGMLKEMILLAAGYLERDKAKIDALNVFPVPDGDTGTNMSMTLTSSAREVQACKAETLSGVASAMAMGALKGARGNSGVILSQLFRGFSKGVDGLAEATPAQFAKALDGGVRAAYKAVMKPKEGTILTVARETANAAVAAASHGSGLEEVMERSLEVGRATLAKTPDMLPVLKEAGVVDSGGMGLLTIYGVWSMYVCGEEVEFTQPDFSVVAPVMETAASESAGEIEFGYCTEFLVKNVHENVREEDVDHFREKLMAIGDCVLVVGDMNLIKVHVHTNTPGKALQFALRFGELTGIKIENMREQHTEFQPLAPEKKELAVVAVASGEGISAVLRELGTDGLVSGGQSMNPSTDDILKAINATNAINVLVLPNNKNIILAAEQAQELTETRLFVLPSRSIPQGIAAMLAYDPEKGAEENAQAMTAALKTVKTGQITYAVRDAKLNGVSIAEGDTIGLFDGDIVVSGGDAVAVSMALLEKMTDEDTCMITVFSGSGVTEEETARLKAQIEEKYSKLDLEVQSGGQAVYEYIFSVE